MDVATIEVLASILDEREVDGAKIVRTTADQLAGSARSDRQWRLLLHDGYSDDIIVKNDLTPSGEAESAIAAKPVAATEANKDAIEILFVPADGLYDGRFANNGWLQELPQSLTKMSWDNAAVMSPRTAAAIDVKHELMVALEIGDAKIELPVYEMPGIAHRCRGVDDRLRTNSRGHGRRKFGQGRADRRYRCFASSGERFDVGGVQRQRTTALRGDRNRNDPGSLGDRRGRSR